MAPRNLLLLFLFTSLLLLLQSCASGSHSIGTRKMLVQHTEDEQQLPKIKKSTLTSSTKNKIKPIQSTKNQTKLIKPTLSPKNQTKTIASTNSTKLQKQPPPQPLLSKSKTELKKLNSTIKSSSSSDLDLLLKPTTTKNKTTSKTGSILKSDQKPKKIAKKPSSIWIDEDDEDDLVAEFRDLPSKFQQTLIPDLERISSTSRIYITNANKEMTKGFKPIVGKKYASTIASIVSFGFALIPLLLVSLIFNRIKAYFSLQKLLIFIQVYLSIYFSILCFSALVTGLEPLRFFYATSQSTYVCLQLLQTLAYLLYLLLLVMYLLLVFSTDCGLGSKFLGLAQAFVGLAVGLHYYVSVFHRVVLRQPPRTNWKVHGIYATCFLVICVMAQAERRKKAYLEEGGEEGKKS